ncbi:TPA: transposase [Escherichia coli]
MSQKYLIRIAELERLLSEQAEALRQKDQQLILVEETEAFLRSALARAEEKIEEDERETEHLRAQIEKLRRMLFGTRSEKLRREVEQAEALLKQRELQSKPLLTSLYKLMQEKEHTLSKKCRLRDAFRYIRKHWVALCNFCDDGLAEADNNTAERALRAVCLGKKNSYDLCQILSPKRPYSAP